MNQEVALRCTVRCLVGGVALGLTIALGSAPLAWHWLCWVSLVPLLLAWDGLSRRESALAGLVAGVCVNVATFSWLGPSLWRFAELPPLLCAAALLAFALWEALPFVAIGLIDWAARERAAAWRWLIFPCAFVLMERVWPRLFPWGLGTPQVANLVVAQLLDVAGPLGLTFVVALSNCALHALWTGQSRRRAAIAAAGVALAVIAYGVSGLMGWSRSARADDSTRPPQVVVGWVQPNRVKNHLRPDTDAEVWEALRAGARAVSARGAPPPDLVVFSEGAVPEFWTELEPGQDQPRLRAEVEATRRALEGRLAELARVARAPILIGVTRRSVVPLDAQRLEVVRRWNVMLLVGPEGVQDAVAKRQLLPFAEYLPGEELLPVLRSVVPSAGRFSPGRKGTLTLRTPSGWWDVGVLICYEAIWARPYGRQAPAVLINPTNDVWFGEGQGPALHAMISRQRAIEARRPLIRVASTGITQVVDVSGRVVDEAGLGVAASGVSVARFSFAGGTGRTTFYLWAGDWIAVLAACVVFWLAVRGWTAPREAPLPALEA